MNLYLMRHADAVLPSDWPGDDSTRPLTALGAAKLELAVQEMARVGFSASRLLTSPVLRARQTAEVIQKYFPSIKSAICPELSAGSSLAKMKKLVERHSAEPSLWLLGHMPDLAILASRLTTQASLMERRMNPGEILALEADLSDSFGGQGRVLWTRSLDDWKGAKQIDV